MEFGDRRAARRFRPAAERVEARLVMSVATTVAGEVRALLRTAPGGTLVRPNTPVVPLESPAATATFVDPSVQIVRGGRVATGSRDYVAPFVALDARGGFIRVGSSASIGDNASLVANPTRAKGSSGILIGDNTVIGPGVQVTGPAAIGFLGGGATAVGANAIIDGAIVQAGAFVGALARVGPGVTIESGFRVLPGADVTTQAEATDPALGMVVRVTPADTAPAIATATIARTTALAAGYTNLYQGLAATGPGTTVSGGPVPTPLVNSTTIFFGNLSNVEGVSREPTSAFVPFEPAAGTPTFRALDGTNVALDQNLAFAFPARVIGQVVFGQDVVGVRRAVGRRDSIRGDQGQPITFAGPLGGLGDAVTIASPLGGVRSTTTTTVVTTTTAAGATTATTTATTTTAMAAPTATPGTTTATTTGRNAAGVATTGTVTTTVANTTALVGTLNIGANFRAGAGATILGVPTALTTFGDDVTVGPGAVVDGSSLGSNVTVGAGAYVAASTIPAGTAIPPGAIIVANVYQGQVRR